MKNISAVVKHSCQSFNHFRNYAIFFRIMKTKIEHKKQGYKNTRTSCCSTEHMKLFFCIAAKNQILFTVLANLQFYFLVNYFTNKEHLFMITRIQAVDRFYFIFLPWLNAQILTLLEIWLCICKWSMYNKICKNS